MFKTLEPGFGSTGDTPVGVSVFPYELMMPRRRWVEDSMHLVLWNEHEKGGHFDPILVDVFFKHLPEFLDIRNRFKDELTGK